MDIQERIDRVQEAFQTIIKSKKLSKKALKHPSGVLTELGIEVSAPHHFDAYIFEMLPNLKDHFKRGKKGKPTKNVMLKCSSPKCDLCLATTATAATALIMAAIAAFPEAEEIIAEIAELLDIEADAVEEIIKEIVKGTLSVTGAIKKLCQLMGTC